MIPTILPTAAFALQAPAADTVVALTARSGLEMAADIALVALTGTLFLLALALVILLLKLKRTISEVSDRALQKADPALQAAHGAAQNVEFVTGVIREDVQRIHRLVAETTEKLDEASERLEERIGEFNALMDVVQAEAEDLFVDTAATVRGVKAGARSLGHGEEDEDAEERSRTEA